MGFIIAILWYILMFFTGSPADKTKEIDAVINSKSTVGQVSEDKVSQKAKLNLNSDEATIRSDRNKVESWDDQEFEPTIN
jgi:hypothetical protein